MPKNSFLSNTFVANSFESTTWTGTSATEPDVVVTPAVQSGTIFQALYDVFDILPTSYSGFILENTALPHCNLVKISNVLVGTNSCNERVEESIYQFIVHSRSKRETRDLLDLIEAKYDTIALNVQSVDVMSTIWNGRSITEIEPGIFKGTVEYLITAERTLENIPALITADNLSTGLFDRFNTTTRLKNMVNGFYTSAFALEGTLFSNSTGRPYIVIPSEDHELLLYNSCNKRMEGIFISLIVYNNQLDYTIDIQQEIMKQFDYSSYELGDSTWTSLNWQSDGMTEIEPGLWEGSIDYLVTVEK